MMIVAKIQKNATKQYRSGKKKAKRWLTHHVILGWQPPKAKVVNDEK